MKYYVETWDHEQQAWTPQSGVRCGPYSKWGLRRALRKLRGMGYEATKSDCSTLVYGIRHAVAAPVLDDGEGMPLFENMGAA